MLAPGPPSVPDTLPGILAWGGPSQLLSLGAGTLAEGAQACCSELGAGGALSPPPGPLAALAVTVPNQQWSPSHQWAGLASLRVTLCPPSAGVMACPPDHLTREWAALGVAWPLLLRGCQAEAQRGAGALPRAGRHRLELTCAWRHCMPAVNCTHRSGSQVQLPGPLRGVPRARGSCPSTQVPRGPCQPRSPLS